MAGCKNGTDPADPTNSLYQLDIIKVPLDHPERAEVIPGARIFTGLDVAPACATLCAPDGSQPSSGVAAYVVVPTRRSMPTVAALGPAQLPRRDRVPGAAPARRRMLEPCHHGRYLEPGEAGAAVRHYRHQQFPGPAHRRVQQRWQEDPWTDEWGGGTGPMCQAGSIMELGGNTIVTSSADNKKLTQNAYFKLPDAQTAQENCVSHNGGLVPVPGRDLYVQGWYQGGVDIMDFTDANHPSEIAYFDRGPIDPPNDTTNANSRSRYTIGGSWGAYYWNGYIYSSELDRGFDVYGAHAERAALGERDRRGKAGDDEGVQPAEPAEARLASGVRRGALVPRPVRAQRRSLLRSHLGDFGRARRRGEEERCGACRGAHRARRSRWTPTRAGPKTRRACA